MKKIILRVLGTIAVIAAAVFLGFIVMLMNIASLGMISLTVTGFILLPVIFLPLIWAGKKGLKISGILLAVCAVALAAEGGVLAYRKSITINTSPNIKVSEYLPFDENSRIVRLDNASLHLEEDLPKLDGAAAVFPVYSAFVNAVYPQGTALAQRYSTPAAPFSYTNTVSGYKRLAEKEIDIFFGAYPSEEQLEDARQNNTTFECIPIGYEAFVFFVNKDNPVDSLTQEQLRGIYSGQITNWSEVGGPDRKITAYQRNEGSGSQSMLKRFMDGTPLMDPPTEQVQDLMSGIIDVVSDYRNNVNAIGFSFRYYLETLIANPDVKMVSIDGAYPSVENIKNGSYAIVTPLYAVTYEERTNENVDRLIDWILSDEGQYIIEQTGYAGVN